MVRERDSTAAAEGKRRKSARTAVAGGEKRSVRRSGGEGGVWFMVSFKQSFDERVWMEELRRRDQQDGDGGGGDRQ